ncbi:MAG: hypothetical protein LC732_06295 [Acidobacteria bacterium]|nr:hypothetical protein [Acidobacteriota bacterium]
MNALLLLALLATPPASVAPAAPTVGDPISIRFQEERAKITIAPSDQYEIVKSGASPAVVRAFRPGTIAVRGRVESANGSFGFRDLKVEIRSVLAEDDSLEPAPFRPPAALPANETARWAMGIAALAALALWVAVWRVRDAAPAPGGAVRRSGLAPRVEYLAELRRARALELHPSLVVIGGAVRRFLARVHPSFGSELTSRELRRELRRQRIREDLVATVDRALLEADLEKFSPWGAPEVDREERIGSAERLAELDRGGDA